MSEIRYCKLRDTDVIIAPERLHRPTQFVTPADRYTIDECPFEQGSEDATPDEICSITDKEGNWLCRVVPNLYNALNIEETKTSKREGFFTVQNGFGAHEVIIETPSHDKTVDKYTLEQWGAYLRMVKNRLKDLSHDFRIEYIQVFKNHGSLAGATLRHPHSQILATGFIPSEIKQELKRSQAYFKVHKRSLLLDLSSEELRIGKRIIFENNTFVAFVPYAALYPFEIMITPKEQISDIASFNQSQMHDLAQLLKNVYQKLYKTLGDFHYNMIFKNLPPMREESDKRLLDYCDKYHTFYIQIIPRIYTLAGFELASGMRINPITPEMAAKKLKEVL